MADEPTGKSQSQEPAETSAHREGSRLKDVRKEIQQRRGAARDARVAATGRLRETVAHQLEPVSSRWRALRERIEENRRWAYPLIGLVLVVIAAMLPFLGDWFELPDWARRATSGSALARVALFALFALGLNVVVGFAGLLDLGYVAFWAMGSYTAAILSGAHAYTRAVQTGAGGGEAPVWDNAMWLVFFAALVVAIIGGVALGSPTLRLRGDYLAIVTLGFGEIVRITANNLDTITGGPRGIRNIPHPEIHVGGLDIVWGTLLDRKYYWLLLFFVVLWVIAIKLLDNSRIGRAWVAIREDEVAAAAMGVPIVRMKLTAFAIGACTAAFGGVVYAAQVNFINPPTFSIIQSILILSMVVIGGMGSIPGAILGAVAVVILPEVFRGFEDYRFFVFGFVLVLVMVFRPQGLIPSRRRKAELQGGTVDEQLYEASTA